MDTPVVVGLYHLTVGHIVIGIASFLAMCDVVRRVGNPRPGKKPVGPIEGVFWMALLGLPFIVLIAIPVLNTYFR